MRKDLKGIECGKGLSLQKKILNDMMGTYVTWAIERGMQPKVLQKLLGHSSIKTTMDTYVHVTEDSLTRAVQQFEANNLNAVSP